MAFYQANLDKHGLDDPQALSYNSRKTQEARFAQFLKLIPSQTPANLLDIGCGLGDLFGYLSRHNYYKLSYTGLDVVPEMIAGAKKKYPQNNFICGDLFSAKLPTVDYVVASGALNIVFTTPEEQEQHITEAIVKMWSKATRGLAFNLLNKHSQDQFEQDAHFFYSDPAKVLGFCQKLTPRTALIDNYLDYDFTIVMKKS